MQTQEVERKDKRKTERRAEMKAVAVIPGKANSVHLREVPKPPLENASNGRGVLVKVLRVGDHLRERLGGTTKESPK